MPSLRAATAWPSLSPPAPLPVILLRSLDFASSEIFVNHTGQGLPVRMRPLLLASLLSACAPAHHAPEYLAAPAGPVRPFSPAVRVGSMLYLAGQIGTDTSGKVVAGGIQGETRQALENIRAVLARAGSSMDHVVKCTVFLADMREWAAMNEVYVTFFAVARRPARSAFGTTGLALDARVEIECLAAA